MITESGRGERRFGPYLIVVPATATIGALGSSLGGTVAAIIGAIVRFGWGLLIGFGSRWLQRWPTFSRRSLVFAASEPDEID
jgi:hypothetical protein